MTIATILVNVWWLLAAFAAGVILTAVVALAIVSRGLDALTSAVVRGLGW